MGVLTPDPYMDRVRDLITDYANTYVDLIDTANNALADATSDSHFTTPTVPDACVLVGDDESKQGEEVRIIITDEGERRSVGMDEPSYEPTDGSAAVSTHPSMHRTLRIGVLTLVRNDGGSQTTAGATARWHARRVCNRVTEAIAAIFTAYPSLPRPAGSTAALRAALAPAGAKIVDDSRAQGYEVDSETGYGRQLILEVTAYEKLA